MFMQFETGKEVKTKPIHVCKDYYWENNSITQLRVIFDLNITPKRQLNIVEVLFMTLDLIWNLLLFNCPRQKRVKHNFEMWF